MKQGDTMTSILTWQLFAPLMPAAMLLLLGALAFAVSQQKKSLGDSDGKTGSTEPFLDDDEEDELLSKGGKSASSTAATNRSFASALAGLCLLGDASLSQSALMLLRCTPIDGRSVLFYAGQTACPPHYIHWQAIIMLLFVLLTLLPFLPVCMWVLCRLPSSWRIAKWDRDLRWPQQLMMRAIKDNATEPFTSEHWHFTALLALQRLATVLCRTFATEVVEASLVVSMISMFFLVLHMIARPYRVGWVNTLQLIASLCLVCLSMFETVLSAFISATYTIKGSPLEALCHRISYFMALLLIPAPVYLLHGLLVRKADPKWDAVNGALGKYDGPDDGGGYGGPLDGRRMGWGEEEKEESEAAGKRDVALYHAKRRTLSHMKPVDEGPLFDAETGEPVAPATSAMGTSNISKYGVGPVPEG
jgi:hypothetical protein